MAPYDTRLDDSDNPLPNSMRKLRKPVIEKMRRDRINSSIEQLRMLLEKDLKNKQLPAKPEKADILEMAVTFLRQQIQRTPKVLAASSQTLSPMTDVAKFLPLKKQAETTLGLGSVTHGHQIPGQTMCQSLVPCKQSGGKDAAQCDGTSDLWRPW